MTIFGVIMIIAGLASVIYGFNQNNSFESQLESLFSSGNTDPGTIWIIVGAVILIIGIILLANGIKQKKE